MKKRIAGSSRCNKCSSNKSLQANNFQLSFAFQPIVDVRGRSVFAYEALVRGVNGESAEVVLARINESNKYCFDQACRRGAIFAAAKLGLSQYLSINFLPKAIYHPETCIRSTLESASVVGFALDRLIFEAVESECLEDNKHLMKIFAKYREYGFKTAIDDFGAGYSSLSLLADYQPDFLKIDMAIIKNIHLDHVRQKIVHNLMALSNDLNISVIAEGVELREEKDFLSSCGINLMQGYFFAKASLNPLSNIPIEAW
ncbi:EAL domain-containing protein [Pseudomonas koreensis]|uniref:EAL domain-containing protein n=1 Tax=Pseudomonas koreensis TaxID=198620 RepID=UPI003F834BDF